MCRCQCEKWFMLPDHYSIIAYKMTCNGKKHCHDMLQQWYLKKPCHILKFRVVTTSAMPLWFAFSMALVRSMWLSYSRCALLTYLFCLCFNQCNASSHFGSSKHSSKSKTAVSLEHLSACFFGGSFWCMHTLPCCGVHVAHHKHLSSTRLHFCCIFRTSVACHQ